MVHIKTNKTCTHTKAITVSGPVLLSAPPYHFTTVHPFWLKSQNKTQTTQQNEAQSLKQCIKWNTYTGKIRLNTRV